ncbi:sigma-70 family RNA polymerase sigma factor [Haliea sp. E17]|uniref:sigma-70 family RNA polymerase sigma factor n=1 Tax=Haliea sp. E17 TaxID=3401576 RepID=UPI003AB01ECB
MTTETGPQAPEQRNDELSRDLERVGANRDRDAFARLFRHFAPLVKAFALGGSPLAASHAEELVQEVMIKVWQKSPGFDPRKASASTWVYAIARNSRTDMYRRLQKFDTPLNAEDIWPDTGSVELFSSVQMHRDAARVRKMLGELPHEQVQVLTKIYMEGKSQSEAAADLDLPLGTVKSRVRLALNKLQLLVEEA